MNKKKVIIVSIFSVLLTLIIGTFAWFTWRSNKTAMVLTIGDVDKVSVTLAPYQIKGELLPTLSYDSEGNIYTQVTAINNKRVSAKFNLYYHINGETNQELFSQLKYTILKSTDGSIYTKYSEGSLASAMLLEDTTILEESISKGTSYYRVYLWLDGSSSNQANMQNKTFSGELRAVIVKDEITPITAIYSEDDNSLRFYQSKNIPASISIGDGYNGLVVTDIFDVEEVYTLSSLPNWVNNYKDNITKIVVEEEIVPENTAYWFYNLREVVDFDVKKINTSNVQSMARMFMYMAYNLEEFTLDLSNFDTSNVTNMERVFGFLGYNAKTFKLDISNWDTSSVTDMEGMFMQLGRSAPDFTVIGIEELNTENVTNMMAMFYVMGMTANKMELDLSNFDTSKVTDMEMMFAYTGSDSETFKLNLNGFDTSNVTSTYMMFENAGSSATDFSISGLSNWNLTSICDEYNMAWMFYRTGSSAHEFNLDLSGWNLSPGYDLQSMFYETGVNADDFQLNLSGWNTSGIIGTSYMFYKAGRNSKTFKIIGLDEFDMSSVENTGYMFNYAGYSATNFNIGDISNWDTSNVTWVNFMFANAGYTATNWSLDLSKWDVSNVTSHNSFDSGVTSKIIAPTWVK